MKRILLLIFIFLGAASSWGASQKCFFESDCSKDESCVTAKGAATGTCQAKSSMPSAQQTGLGANSIIGEQGKCTFNTDCPDGGQCIKKPGELHGSCQGSGYTAGNLQPEREGVYKDRSCYFDQDCKIGQVCVKPQGSFKGACEDDFYKTNHDIKDAKDPRALLQKFHTSDRQCLVDQDCALREVCLKDENSVFGVCRSRSSLPTDSAVQTTSPSSSLFSNTNSLFSK
ncbi:MAG: hypothetical protein JNN05_06980 [Candidatus Omnitrophica bacterium]|nr:hypothetical protein [Candidatus Omnitrophota bacterium]